MSDKANPYFAATENGDLEFSFSPIVWGQDARAFLLDFSKLDIKGGTGFKYLGSPYTFSLEFSCECHHMGTCLLYTSPSPRDRQKSRMPSSA